MTKRRADSRPAAPARACRFCHCTEEAACHTIDGECHWLEADLCSACAGVAIAHEIIEERFRQVDAEGFSSAHDDGHPRGELAMAAAALASFSTYSDARRGGHRAPSPMWPAAWRWNPKDRRRDLIRAGALIIAELERLDRRARTIVGELAGEEDERRAS